MEIYGKNKNKWLYIYKDITSAYEWDCPFCCACILVFCVLMHDVIICGPYFLRQVSEMWANTTSAHSEHTVSKSSGFEDVSPIL